MPIIQDNIAAWDSYAWPGAGDEWSVAWGGTNNLWKYVIYERIKEFIPTHRIVEIAPGFGRWTQFLQQYCDQLTAVDISKKCVENSQKRFANLPHVQVIQNDGLTLPGVEDSSIDFVYSFDSLVHVESDTLGSYLRELARVLRPGGIAFIHHSNMGAYKTILRVSRRLPDFANRSAGRIGVLPVLHWRAESVTAKWVSEAGRKSGLTTIRQELINWGNDWHLIDCFSTLRRFSGKSAKIVKNRNFMAEAEQIRLGKIPTAG
jgi:ubiquinone/menaquinone biosynthesis C-methylase UbiE